MTAWLKTTLGECADILTGYPFQSEKFVRSGVRLVRGSNVKRGILDWSADIARFWPVGDHRLGEYLLNREDVVIAMDGALVGRSFSRIGNGDLPAYLVQRVARIRAKNGSQQLLYHWIGSREFEKHVDSLKTHSAIPHVSPRDLRDFEISLPVESREQSAIAEALDDADALIAGLERMVTKKEAVKQGMMQQLLTGRTRLPGFTAPWHTRRLGDIGSFLKGRGIRRGDVRQFGVPCVRYGELYTGYRNYTRVARSYIPRGVAAAATPLEHGDLLFAGSGETRAEIGNCAAYLGPLPAVAGGDVIILRGTECNPVFLGSLLNAPDAVRQKSNAGQGDAVVHISVAALAGVQVALPNRPEQDAISSAIGAVDLDLRAAERRLGKARLVKEGMTQQLLTGRVRLLDERVA